MVRELAKGHAYTCLPDDDATVALLAQHRVSSDINKTRRRS